MTQSTFLLYCLSQVLVNILELLICCGCLQLHFSSPHEFEWLSCSFLIFLINTAQTLSLLLGDNPEQWNWKPGSHNKERNKAERREVNSNGEGRSLLPPWLWTQAGGSWNSLRALWLSTSLMQLPQIPGTLKEMEVHQSISLLLTSPWLHKNHSFLEFWLRFQTSKK